MQQARIDAGAKPSLTTDERMRLAQLKREIRELRRANAILKSASAFFAAEMPNSSACSSCSAVPCGTGAVGQPDAKELMAAAAGGIWAEANCTREVRPVVACHSFAAPHVLEAQEAHPVALC